MKKFENPELEILILKLESVTNDWVDGDMSTDANEDGWEV